MRIKIFQPDLSKQTQICKHNLGFGRVQESPMESPWEPHYLITQSNCTLGDAAARLLGFFGKIVESWPNIAQ